MTRVLWSLKTNTKTIDETKKYFKDNTVTLLNLYYYDNVLFIMLAVTLFLWPVYVCPLTYEAYKYSLHVRQITSMDAVLCR